MKRPLLITTLALLALLLNVGPAQAAPAGTLQAFGTGAVTITGPDSATIVNQAGQFGGAFTKSKSQSGMLLGDVTFSFVSTGDEAGGAPRFSLPINTDGTGGSVAGYAFIDAPGCNGFNVINGATVTVSTTSSSCGVNFQGVEYTNWAQFAADFPTYRIAQGHFPFVIADEPGSYAVNSIVLG